MQQIYKFIINKRPHGVIFMLFLWLLSVLTPIKAQVSDVQITLYKKNVSVIEALKVVEKQANLSIAYNESQLKDKTIVSLNLEKVSLIKALSDILKDSGYTYQLKGKYVIIVPLEKKLIFLFDKCMEK